LDFYSQRLITPTSPAPNKCEKQGLAPSSGMPGQNARFQGGVIARLAILQGTFARELRIARKACTQK
jgi:hypothetical protein